MGAWGTWTTVNRVHRSASRGAPISWGICEVPGWGEQLPVDRVLTEMRSVGLTATELGAIGWLPTDPAELKAVLDDHDVHVVGAFVPLTCHDPARRERTLAEAEEMAALLQDIGAENFVTAVGERSRGLVAPGAVRRAVDAPVLHAGRDRGGHHRPRRAPGACTPTPTRSSRPRTRSSGSCSPRRRPCASTPATSRWVAPIPWRSPTATPRASGSCT